MPPNVFRHPDDYRQPHRQTLRPSHRARHDQGHGPAADPDGTGRLRADDVRPGVSEHGVVPQPHHLHRRRQGHPALPRLSDRTTGRAQHVPRNGVSDSVRRAADAGAARRRGRTKSRCTRCCTRTSRSSWRAFSTTPIRWASCSPRSGCLSTIYPDAKRISSEDSRRLQIRRLIAKVPTIAAWAYRHSIGRPYVYPDNDLSFTGQLPEHAVQDDRAEVPAASGAGARARRAVHPARRPRAELQHERDARHRQLAGGSVLGAGGRGRARSPVRCTAAPTKPCCAC